MRQLTYNNTKTLKVVELGAVKYETAYEIQRKIFKAKQAGYNSDCILLVEHPHTYTIGKTGTENHLLVGADRLAESGAILVYTDRGGDITYHGPGQLVAYPILDLSGYYHDLHRYLRDLEQALIITAATFGIGAHRKEGLTGIWVREEKLAAIGIKMSRWITMHGVALNVNTDLSYFDKIVPCGIDGKGVTSISKIIGREVGIKEACAKFTEAFSEVFEVRMERGELGTILQETIMVERTERGESLPTGEAKKATLYV